MTALPETIVPVEPLTEATIAPYGWLLGKPLPANAGAGAMAYASAASDIWHEHGFDPGAKGETEILWVKYRSTDPVIATLEAHSLTQQAVIPLTGSIIQIMATGDGAPDPATARAFTIAPGHGICMRPGTWHATRAVGGEATCLMLTRRSTTADLVRHLNSGVPAGESAFSRAGTFVLYR